MDLECIELCEAMNKISGINTIDSCCGHGKFPYRVFFRADNLECLPDLLYWFDVCHCGFTGWLVKAKTDCVKSPVSFCVERIADRETYAQSLAIARLIRVDQE